MPYINPLNYLLTYLHGLFKEPIIGPLKSKMAEIRYLENRHAVIFFCRGWSDLNKISQTGISQNDMSTAVIWSKSKPDVEFQYSERLGKFHGMSSQSHVSHCRVLPLGEFTVTIPEPHLAKSMSCSCHIAGCNNFIRHIENRFRHVLFCFVFLMQFGL